VTSEEEDLTLGIEAEVDRIEKSLVETVVYTIPKCDFCSNSAAYDGKTVHGSWAYMCRQHFATEGRGLGLGRGQRLILQRVTR
jgi:hypothetical protein